MPGHYGMPERQSDDSSRYIRWDDFTRAMANARDRWFSQQKRILVLRSCLSEFLTEFATATPEDYAVKIQKLAQTYAHELNKIEPW
jgi:hypothetical protein